MKIYVAGKYSGIDARMVQENVNAAIEAGCELIRKGHAPYIPHLLHNMWMHPKGNFEYDIWMKIGTEFLLQCDAILVISSSPGADKEKALAEKMNMTVYTDVNDVPVVKEHEKEGTN